MVLRATFGSRHSHKRRWRGHLNTLSHQYFKREYIFKRDGRTSPLQCKESGKQETIMILVGVRVRPLFWIQVCYTRTGTLRNT